MYQLLVAETTFIIQGIMFMLLFGAYLLAQDRKIAYHRKMMEYMFWIQTILNIVMVISFFAIPADISFIPHMIVATPIYFLILYTYLVMERKLPKKLMFPREHRTMLMRVTAVFWGIAIVSGLASFIALGM